jgi:uncharacterized membrane protein
MSSVDCAVKRLGCLSLVIAVILMVVLPWVLADMLATALLKLRLSPNTAGLLVLAIFGGSLINIPVKRIIRNEFVPIDPLAVFGLQGWWPETRRAQAETIVAVNVGGCVIPVGLAVYEVLSLAPHSGALGALAAATVINVAVCYRLARPVEGVGIMMPALVPAVIACSVALMMSPANATPIAFVAGVAGPLVGADLFHLRDVERIASGMVSIGGAGTFDGILLTGILALYLA